MGNFNIRDGKHVSCLYENLPNIRDMIFTYWDKPEYKGTMFVLNYALSVESLYNLRHSYGFKRIIFYNLEHLTAAKYNEISNKWREYLIETYYEYDEIWDFLIENYNMYPNDLKSKYKFFPMRYVKYEYKKTEKIVDLFFAGVIDTNVRHEFIHTISQTYKDNQIGTIIAECLWGDKCYKFMEMSKFILDYPHYRLFGNTQNCVRIHDALCNNTQVITYTDTERSINYFGDMVNVISPIKGFDYERTFDIVKKYKNVDIAEKYRNLTEKDDCYERYRKEIMDTYL